MISFDDRKRLLCLLVDLINRQLEEEGKLTTIHELMATNRELVLKGPGHEKNDVRRIIEETQREAAKVMDFFLATRYTP